MLRIALVSVLWCCSALPLFAQLCPRGAPDQAQLARALQDVFDPDIVFRAAAIGGPSIIPELRRVSQAKPGIGSSARQPVTTAAGAAQASLARLGDAKALEQLRQEMNDSRGAHVFVADKLFRVGTDEALAILMDYFVAHVHDESLYHDFGDYTGDFRSYLIGGVQKWFRVGPTYHKGEAMSVDAIYSMWVSWWKDNQGKHLVVPIVSGVQIADPFLACLVHKVEWGFPNAIFDMADSDDPQLTALLKKLELVGDPESSLDSIHGRAQFVLAKSGDEQAFSAIVHRLKDGESYDASVKALELLGGKRSTAVLMAELDDSEFLIDGQPARPDYVQGYVESRDRAIVSALHNMILHPPDFTWKPAERKDKWKDWWARNKDVAQFVPIPVKRYE